MDTPLRLLMLEDSPDDELLVLAALRAGGYNVQHLRVWSAEAMRRALQEDGWELIISDYCMPNFDAPQALAIANESTRDLPFIIVSGTVGEEQAVAAMRAGARDYVMKESLGRLAPSVRRELNEARERVARREAQRVAAELTRENERAEAINFARRQFLANVSHELRTPLNAIIGFSELLDQGTAGALAPKQSEYVRYVLSSGRHLLSLVGDILDLSKVDAGKMDLLPEPTALSGVAVAARDTLQPVASKRGVTLILQIAHDLPLLDVDPLRLRQMLYNLISNGIKFTPSGGRVTISAQVLEDQLEIRVSDTGIGIPREDLPRLFQEFEQVSAQGDGRVAGSGLGLALTKRLVELHGGSVSVESVLGEGSTFALRLPLPAQAAATAPHVPLRTVDGGAASQDS
jgi:signal transduction histidine kinase